MSEQPRAAEPPDAAAQYALNRRQRVERLKRLVERSAYDAPADQVALSIIRDALLADPADSRDDAPR